MVGEAQNNLKGSFGLAKKKSRLKKKNYLYFNIFPLHQDRLQTAVEQLPLDTHWSSKCSKIVPLDNKQEATSGPKHNGHGQKYDAHGQKKALMANNKAAMAKTKTKQKLNS